MAVTERQAYGAEPDKGREAAQKSALGERLQAIVGRLTQDAEERMSSRSLIEQRWLTDLTQYHGRYESKILKELSDSKKSQLFINQTRPKTNACEARLSDMLFPTDDRNWGIEPTPVPELALEAERAVSALVKTKERAGANPQDALARASAERAEQRAGQVQAIMDEAKERASAMQAEIDDHLRECRYAIQARQTIHDACKLGTGIIKGPVIGERNRRSWQQTEQGFALIEVNDARPVYWRVNPWGFYPDMDARSMEDCESVFERHLLNPKQLRALARQPGFDAEAIRKLLRAEPRASVPYFIADLRSITGAFNDSGSDRYHVFEYHGPLAAQEIKDLAQGTGKPDVAEDAGLTDEGIDPLLEVQATVWFCDGELLKFGIHHLDSGEPIYSVFCLERDEESIFGFGVPYLMRDAQKSINAAWRTMQDNAGLSSGPQIVVNQDVIEPANGTWGLEPRKIWLRKPGSLQGVPAFESYDIPMHQAELANIIVMARELMDEETGVSTLAQGEQGAHTTQTAHGMSILMNAVNVVFRRIVKNFDDEMTTPNIRRLYDWLMQFSKKEHIKGDFEVDARGTSVLLVRELQSQNLMTFLANFSAHPSLGAFLKEDGLPALRRLAQTMMIPADDIIKTDQQVKEEQAAAAQNPPPPMPDVMKIEAEMNRAEMERKTKLALAEMEQKTKLTLAQFERESELMRLAAQHNMKLDELRSKLFEGRSERDSKERIFAAEAAVEHRMARESRAQESAQKDSGGSGGYLSQ